ncbi:OmpA family protein [Microbulbifer thermotolerans]|uniref:OmpA family protein n=1 Tax=Microbulbifer thermotolerans TaxID=252514 RepID=UPI00224A8CB8|nr:OmpA family protein [Microbulbifer thermotolerans]MCX2782093.1 OmpA family protein [Microbulbifer thermotolerans]MCX2843119.1 OmpA family protein [Microbulbifer thermotolerans]
MAIPHCPLRRALLLLAMGVVLALVACHDPHKKYALTPLVEERGSGGEVAAPFAEQLVRYLRGVPRAQGNEFILQVRYAPGGFAPLMDSIGDIEALLVIMRDFPALRIVIEGHTDSEGDPEKNLKLSQWRADWVRHFLLERGIAEERVQAEGFGDSRPIADNSTPEGQAKNRRLVIRLLNFATQSTALPDGENRRGSFD